MQTSKTTMHSFTLGTKYELTYADGSTKTVIFNGTKPNPSGQGTIYLFNIDGQDLEFHDFGRGVGGFVKQRELP